MSHSKDEKKAAYKALSELLDGTDRDEMECEGFEFCQDCGELITEESENEEIEDSVCLACGKEREAYQSEMEEREYEYLHR